jgi:hypothetical protein
MSPPELPLPLPGPGVASPDDPEPLPGPVAPGEDDFAPQDTNPKGSEYFRGLLPGYV